jgi:methoxymalonate biosynthesis protein
MRILKLVIWDLDETILTGILEEGDEEVNPAANQLMRQLNERGILQALATQNPPGVVPVAIEKFGWAPLFVRAEADLKPKAKKVQHILDSLDIAPLDTAFVDEDPFERGAISAQISGLTAWSIADLASYLDGTESILTREALRRPQMMREQQARDHDAKNAGSYADFLRSCNIQVTIRPYAAKDAGRAEELLTRTHRMNLGVLPVAEAIARLIEPGEHHIIVAEMQDIYGDMGRCGLAHLRSDEIGGAVIESLAISCRTRARGLALAMLVGMLRHDNAKFQRYRCRYVFNGTNRPLRMLLMSAGFKPQPDTGELTLQADQLTSAKLPDWVQIRYQGIAERDTQNDLISRPSHPNSSSSEDSVAYLAALALGKKPGHIGLDDPLLSGQAGFDSISLMEFVLRIEDAFGINIPDADLDPDIFYSVRTVTSYLRARLEPRT